MAIRLFLAMRSELFIKSFTRSISRNTKQPITVVGSCETTEEIEPLFKHLKPDILIMDIKISNNFTFSQMRRLILQFPQIKIIGVSAEYHQDIAQLLEQAGSKAYLRRNDDKSTIENLIYEVWKGNTAIYRVNLPNNPYPNFGQ